jgi:hypothetical protein
MPYKRCPDCGKRKPLTPEYWYYARERRWFHSYCKPCYNARGAARERANPRDRREYNKQWEAKNRERRRAEGTVRFKTWRDENREHRLEWERKYHRTEKYRAKNVIYHENRRARKLAAPGEFSADDVAAILKRQKFRCFYCGTNIRNCHTVDHYVPLSRGGTNWPDNIRCACRPCNISKNDFLPDKWGR